MGEKALVDKTVVPLSTTLTNLTPALVTAGSVAGNLGNLPIGYYKGSAAFWDLDLAVNQPNVLSEQEHILGILDGREEGYDLRTLTTVVGVASPVGTILAGTLTVPAGEVWYINAVQSIVNCVGAANGLVGNWRCSLWTDRAATPNAAGQSFHPPAGLATAAGATVTTLDEFGGWTTVLAIANKVPMLRLPAGAIVSFVLVTATAQVDVAAASTLQLFGTVGKVLVA